MYLTSNGHYEFMKYSNNYKRPAVLLGLSLGSLHTGRILARSGIQSFGVSRTDQEIGAKSKYIKVIGAPKTYEYLLNVLLNLATNSNIKPVIFLMSDYYIRFFAEYSEQISSHYLSPITDPQSLVSLASKAGSAQMFSNLDIDCPRTIVINGKFSTKQITEQMTLPCILKPDYHNDLENVLGYPFIPGGSYKRTYLIETKESLKKTLSELSKHSKAIVQEFIPGSSTNLFYYVGYRDRKGKIATSFIGQKLRTYPDRLGSETLLESIYSTELLTLGDNILHKLNYKGPAGIDFKYDTRTGSYKVIEVNCRLGINDTYLFQTGINLPLIYYNDSQGIEIPPIRNYSVGVTWYNFKQDFEWMISYNKEKKVGWWKWFKSLIHGYNSYAVYNSRDLGPFVYESFMLMRKIILGLFRKLSMAKNIIERKR